MRALLRRLALAGFLTGLGGVAICGFLIWRAAQGASGIGSLVPAFLAAGGLSALGAFGFVATAEPVASEDFGSGGNGGDDPDGSPDGDAGGDGGGGGGDGE